MRINDRAHDTDIQITVTINDQFIEKRAGRVFTEGEKALLEAHIGKILAHDVICFHSMLISSESLHDLFNPEEAAIPTLFESLTDEQIAGMRGEQTDDWVGPDLDGRDGQEN